MNSTLMRTKIHQLPTEHLAHAYQNDIERFNNWLAEQNELVTLKNIWRYFEEMITEGKVAPASMQKYKSAIRKAMIFAMGRGIKLIDVAELDSFFKGIKIPKPETKVKIEDVLTIEELEKLIKTSSKRTSLIIQGLYHTACRSSELTNIRLDNCKQSNGRIAITVLGKNRKIRSVYMPTKLFNEIREAYKGQIYLYEKFGTTLSAPTISTRIKQMGIKINRKDISAHTLRHTWATHARQDGMEIEQISEYLGHVSISTTADYYFHNHPTGERVSAVTDWLS